MKYVLTSSFLVIILIASVILPAHAQAPRFVVLVNQETFVPGDILVIYGKTFANDTLVVRLYDPAGKSVRIETVRADAAGSFTAQIFTWPEPSRNFVFGRYAVEITSNTLTSIKETKIVSFSDTSTVGSTRPPSGLLAVKLDSPTEISVNRTFRIFVQVTFDGALVNVQTDQELSSLLGSSHIHSGNTTINLAGQFFKLHEGIYYSDVQLTEPGSYIIHAMAFYRGFLAHDSKVVSSGSSISQVQESINTLKVDLDNTSQDLKNTEASITGSVENATMSIRQEVADLQQASGQINSIIIPILALIAIVIALQISLFARIRASYK
jgi:hypothetical protein